MQPEVCLAKTSNGIGHVITGVALDFIAFPSKAVPGEIAEETLFKLGLIDGPFAMIWGLDRCVLLRQI